ncbi:hypothetical protein D3C71_2079950 [compost metagenome]
MVFCPGGAVGSGKNAAADAARHAVQYHLRYAAGPGAVIALLPVGFTGVGLYLAVPLAATDPGADRSV